VDIRRDRVVAIGDPQAPFDRFLGVLRAHGLLEGERLKADVGLVSIGDHFDWGPVAARGRAADDGMRLVRWLSAHPRDQVVMIAGNHDLARVGELWGYDDRRFFRAQALADAHYLGGSLDANEAFTRENPDLPSTEVVSRDFSGYAAAQRELVRALLDDERLVLAYAHGSRLYLHAGVTRDELDALALPAAEQSDASAVAAALNRALRDAWRARGDGPLAIAHLHRPGDGRSEGVGMLYHRAANTPEHEADARAPIPRRKFPPGRLPLGLTQVIGHIQDKKSMSLLGLADTRAPVHGRLRTLTVGESTLAYALGVAGVDPDARVRTACVVHIDGGMQHVEPEQYALFDVVSGRELRPG
jgi:hypothetical protein